MSDTFTTLDGITVDDIPVKFVAGNVLTDPESLFPVPVDEAVQDWLDEHPEATTTVQDGSLTYKKLVTGTLDFVTPEMFGAVGDGVTDDSIAITNASAVGVVLGDKSKKYYISNSCTLSNDICNVHFIVNKEVSIIAKSGCKIIENCEFENDEFYPSTGRGNWILVIQQSDNIIVGNNYFHKGVSALYIDRCNNTKIYGNTFEDFRQCSLGTGGNGYGILLIGTNNTIISGNVFYNVARHSIYISINTDIVSESNTNLLITKNIFKQDENAVGVQGESFTLAIRPSKNVKISNNIFDGVIGVCAITAQDGGDGVIKTSDNIIISENHGTFARNPSDPLSRGVVFITSDIDVADAKVQRLVIENNDWITGDNTFFVVNMPVYEFIISNNKFKISSNAVAHFMSIISPTTAAAWGKFIIKNNRIDGVNRILSIQQANTSIPRIELCGNVFVSISNLGLFINNTCSVTDFLIVNNYIESDLARTYFSDIPVTNLTVRNNTANKNILLLLVPTNLLSTDPVFTGGYITLPATEGKCTAGSLRIQDNDEIYMMNKYGSWIKLN